MKTKAAKKILRKYSWIIVKHNSGVSEAPKWVQKLWRKATSAALKG